MIYRDREHAGELLAESLKQHAGGDACVLGLPRGGMVVAGEVARRLSLPLDVLIARKLGVPGQPEFAFGAIGPGDVKVFDEDLINKLDLSEEEIQRVVEVERRELQRRISYYRQEQEPLGLQDRTVILVDDGIASGATARAGIETLRLMGPREIILAAPVGAPDAVRFLGRAADVVVCPQQPPEMHAIGTWYEKFEQTSDEEVIQLLKELGPREFAKRH